MLNSVRTDRVVVAVDRHLNMVMPMVRDEGHQATRPIRAAEVDTLAQVDLDRV